jgi:hypothetical protein
MTVQVFSARTNWAYLSGTRHLRKRRKKTQNESSTAAVSHKHTHPSHSQTSRLLSTCLSLGNPIPPLHLGLGPVYVRCLVCEMLSPSPGLAQN